MAIASVSAGAYTSSYNGVDVTGPSTGYNDENGFVIEQQTTGELVNNTDLYGESLLDWVHRGGSVFNTFTCMTFTNVSAGLNAVFYPWGVFGQMATITEAIGRLASDVSGPHVLTVVANTPAEDVGPLSITAPNAILPPGFNASLMLSSRVKKVPCKLAYLPYEQAGIVNWYTET